MFPLKILVLAVIIAIAFGPRVNACPAHDHTKTVAVPAAGEQSASTEAAASSKGPAAQPKQAETAAAGQVQAPVAN